MTDREERQHVIKVLQNMLDWMEAANMISSKPERIEAVKYAIASIETDLKYDLLYEETSEQADKPITKNCESCRYYGSHHKVCNYCYKCSLWTEQESTNKNDLALIHTEGLDEEIRCTMCTNSMKSDRGCDGSCVVNKNMYEAVMDVIEKRIQPTTKNNLEVDLPDNNVGNIDCISRADAQTKIEMNASRYSIAKERGGMGQVEWSDQLIKVSDAVDIIRALPPVTPQEPKIGHCKDCKYFEYDSVAKIDGVPLIVAHEICSKWGRGCKTNENGYCFLFESKSEVEE